MRANTDRLLHHPRIKLTKNAYQDVKEDKVNDYLQACLLELADFGFSFVCNIFKRGHTQYVRNPDGSFSHRVSKHWKLEAVDISFVNGVIVNEDKKNDSTPKNPRAHVLMSHVVAKRKQFHIVEIEGPWQYDESGLYSFISLNHIHIAV